MSRANQEQNELTRGVAYAALALTVWLCFGTIAARGEGRSVEELMAASRVEVRRFAEQFLAEHFPPHSIQAQGAIILEDGTVPIRRVARPQSLRNDSFQGAIGIPPGLWPGLPEFTACPLELEDMNKRARQFDCR